MQRPTALITGASGFLGAHLTAACTAAGWHAVAGVRQPAAAWRLDALAPNAPRIAFDITMPEADIAALLATHSITIIFNCAAYGVDYRQQDCDLAVTINVAGPARLTAAAVTSGVQGLVHIGTSYEYGPHQGAIHEETPLNPRGVYGATKAAGSILALERAQTLGIPLSILRPFTFFGPLEGKHKFVPFVASKARQKEPIALTRGEQIRDYLYVEDVASACIALAATGTPPAGGVFNVGSGQPMTLREFGNSAARAAGGDLDLMNWGARPYRLDEVMSVVADPSRLKAATGWHPRVTLEEGLQRTVAALDNITV